jgi:hypothetical protein
MSVYGANTGISQKTGLTAAALLLPAAADTLPHVGAIRKGSRDWTGLIKMTARHFLISENLTSKSFAVLRCHKKSFCTP